MPLAIKWSAFNKNNVRRESDNYGVYELGNVNGILYVGEGQVGHDRFCSLGVHPTQSEMWHLSYDPILFLLPTIKNREKCRVARGD